MSKIIYLSNVRLSFPALIEPRVPQGAAADSKPKYSADFIMPPNHAGFAKFLEVWAAEAADKWKEHASQVMNMVASDRKTRCYGDGREKVNKKTFELYDGYEGNVFLTTTRYADRGPVQIILADGSPVDPKNLLAVQAELRKMYGGCWVNAAIAPRVQSGQYGNGIRCDLLSLQFLRDDEPFGDSLPTDLSELFGKVETPAGTPQFLMPGNSFQQPSQAPSAPAGLPSFMLPK